MPGRVGDFKSESARAHFLRVYRAALAELPAISETQDVPTSFGTVRVYRFTGPADGAPVVLLPGRNASTPMWRGNIGPLLTRRSVIGVDLLGEAGMSVQHDPITGPDDEAQWLDETLAGLGSHRVHLMGVSIGGWTAANYAVRRPGRAASLVLLDPVFTFAPITVKAVLASPALFVPGVPKAVRERVLRWISGGADLDTAETEATLIDAAATDYALRKAMPKMITDAQLRGLDIPVLALIAGRSVMHNPGKAAKRARETLRHGQIELWPDASHAINGEYAAEIAERAAAFWADVDRPVS
ncbi:Pimeloyl-ACP methyl ester carboxylesterase [Mycolicibacterium rutilum]|uniref:Pimeloyl-ACP methyl ester carboxylesterase n=1 Tax=Mycolicibacterium rutilum TaxID=370526 RepID=A0A1H6LUY2_MYCRU|nr:alpha/beta hydrolase [Mycolicibacterium rutilum]SEH92553.1 Pimeloyl-ACP methyl ester carboxylesterase [Mycolicibacterium rutilum]